MNLRPRVDRAHRKFMAALEESPSLADRLNTMSSEDVARSMESLPTDALEWAVRFEALAHHYLSAREEIK